MSIEYIRDYYRVPAKRGGRVFFRDAMHHGTIVGTKGSNLRIRMDGDRFTGIYHPTYQLVYLPPAEEASASEAKEHADES